MVAAKLLWPHHAADREVVTRFVTERTILLGLQHPNIVRVTDLVMEGDRLAIIMDLVPGPSLAKLRRSFGTAPASLAVPLISAVLDGLDYAHQRGVLHRDIKADNILVASDRFAPSDIRIVDFGIAWLGDVGSRTGPERVGTPLYMAPELFADGTAGTAADVYSTAIVLYELLAGRTPFAGGDDETAIALRHMQSAPARLAVDERLWRVIMAMLAKDAANRPSAAQAAAALRALPAAALPAFQLAPLQEPDSWSRAVDAEDGWEVVESPPDKKSTAGRRGGKEGKEAAPPETPVDPNATGLRAKREFVPVQLTDTSVAQAEVEAGGSTALKADSHHSLKRIEVQQEAPRRKRWPFVAVGLTVLLGGTVGVLWATGVLGGRSEPEPEPVAITTMPAYTIGTALPTGLRVDYEASYDSHAETTQLTVTFSALPSSALQGDVLVAIPGLGPECPVVSSDDSSFGPTRASADGFDIDCGYKFSGLEVAAGGTFELDLEVDLDLIDAEGNMPADYSEWLTGIEDATSLGLGQITGTSFALQRINGVTVTAEAVNMDASGGMSVPYQVHAQWTGLSDGSPPSPIMSNETIAGMETELLMSLTGGEGLDSVSVSTCNEAQISGVRVLAMQPTDSCFVQARVGALDSPEGRFTIKLRTSSLDTEPALPEG